jgi:hypothetical protein
MEPRISRIQSMSANYSTKVPWLFGVRTMAFGYRLLCFLASNDRIMSRDSSVGIALDYGLDDWGSRVRFPAGA